MSVHIDQIDLFSAIGKHLVRRHKVKATTPRCLNAVIAAANLIVDAFARDDVPATPGMGLSAWWGCDDKGVSSEFMARSLGPIGWTTSVTKTSDAYPRDADDFGRCARLLEAEPGLREKLPSMADAGEQWAALVANWAELESLYRAKSKKLTQRMQKLLVAKEPA